MSKARIIGEQPRARLGALKILTAKIGPVMLPGGVLACLL